jgi:hypothetical protein
MTPGQRPTASGERIQLIRRILGIVAVVTLLALLVEPRYIQLPFLDRKPIAAAFTIRPDRLWPEFPKFLEEVRARTQNGDAIALIVPTLDWENGYSYAYYRASYFLAGREVLPVADSAGRLHPENFRAAKYAAVWGREIPAGRATVVWRGHGGTLLRRE